MLPQKTHWFSILNLTVTLIWSVAFIVLSEVSQGNLPILAHKARAGILSMYQWIKLKYKQILFIGIKTVFIQSFFFNVSQTVEWIIQFKSFIAFWKPHRNKQGLRVKQQMSSQICSIFCSSQGRSAQLRVTIRKLHYTTDLILGRDPYESFSNSSMLQMIWLDTISRLFCARDAHRQVQPVCPIKSFPSKFSKVL